MAVTVSGVKTNAVWSAKTTPQSDRTINVQKVAHEMLPHLKNNIWILKGVNPMYTALAKTHIKGAGKDPRAGDEFHIRFPREMWSVSDVYDLSGNWSAADATRNPHVTAGEAKDTLNPFNEHIAKIKLDKHESSMLQWDVLEETFNVNPSDWHGKIVERIGNRINSQFTEFLLDHATSLTAEHNTNVGLDKYSIARAVARMEDEGETMSGEWVCALKPSDCAELNDSLITIPNLPAAQVAKRISKPYAGQIGGVDIMKTQDLQDHRTGKFAGTLTIDGVQNGYDKDDANIEDPLNVVIKGVTSTTATDVVFRKGDKFGVENTYSFNRGTRRANSNIQVFTVMKDVKVSDGSGTVGVNRKYTVSVKPGFLVGTKDAYRSLSRGLAVGDKVYMDGLPDTVYGQCLLYQTPFVAFIPCAMPQIKGGPDNAMATTENSLKLHVMTVGDALKYESRVRFDVHWGQAAFCTGFNKIHVIRFKRDPSTANTTANNAHSATTGGIIPGTGRFRFDSARKTS